MMLMEIATIKQMEKTNLFICVFVAMVWIMCQVDRTQLRAKLRSVLLQGTETSNLLSTLLLLCFLEVLKIEFQLAPLSAK